MEAAHVLAFRIFVMLSCLIIVPMAAIFGSAFPDVVKSVLVDRLVAWGTGKPIDTSVPTAEITGFSAVAPANSTAPTTNDGKAWETAPRWGATAAAPPAAGAPTGAMPQNNQVIPAGGPGMMPGANQPAGYADSTDAARMGNGSATDSGYPGSPGAVPVPGGPGMVKQQFSYPAGADPAAATGQTQPVDRFDRFTAIERKLREYGASYYLLETLGNEGEYRFHCRMAVSQNPNYSRHFEATDRDPIRAMNTVLERVEAWRSGRTQ